ncbi:CapA family protein [Porphyromonas sp.]|uniref:CapA family protein n=1 Tax=Porphyromonas sp. TaxID=1924944 RepID=UPI0026DD63AC|nr:CapA family protein [Porphyromonas sp.]MDO4695219.1 CapA family protein [Porphyromonas sp.]MDO4770980.1 CapA family protein [Porphyromonas sp.]
MKHTSIIHKIILILVPLSCTISACLSTESKKQTDTAKGSPQDTLRVTLYFAGDIMMHLPQVKAAMTGIDTYDLHDNYKYISPYIKKADVAIANLETTFGGKPYRGYPQFSSPDTLAYALKDAGFDILTTANNHSVDRGRNGIIRTLDILDKVGIKHLGTYRDSIERSNNHPLNITINGIKLAFLCYTYGTNGISIPPPTVVNLIDSMMLDEVRTIKAKAETDFTIICIHWGNEYQRKEDDSQKRLAQSLLDAGADVIIGSHPHVVQSAYHYSDTATSKSSLVVYSLGNYISNQTKDPATRGGLSTICTLQKLSNGTKSIPNVEYLHTWVSKGIEDGRKRYRIIPITYTERDTSLIPSYEHKEFLRYTQYSKSIVLSDSLPPF